MVFIPSYNKIVCDKGKHYYFYNFKDQIDQN